MSNDIAERVLAHASGGIQVDNDMRKFLDERCHAVERCSAHMMGIVNPGANVTLFEAARWRAKGNHRKYRAGRTPAELTP